VDLVITSLEFLVASVMDLQIIQFLQLVGELLTVWTIG